MPYDKHKQFLLTTFSPENSTAVGQGIRNQEFLYPGKENKPIPKAHEKPEKPVESGELSVKYIETLQPYQDHPIPFSLFIKPKEVLGHNPYEALQHSYVSQEPESLKELRLNRPRLVISPAMAIDAITDDEIYNLVISDTYQTAKMRMDRTLEKQGINIRAPLGHTFKNPNPISLPKVKPPVVPPEWRKDSTSWDKRSIRGHCESTKEFWLKYRK